MRQQNFWRLPLGRVDSIQGAAEKGDSRKLAKKVSKLVHLRDACPSLKEYDVIVTWPRDRRDHRVRA